MAPLRKRVKTSHAQSDDEAFEDSTIVSVNASNVALNPPDDDRLSESEDGRFDEVGEEEVDDGDADAEDDDDGSLSSEYDELDVDDTETALRTNGTTKSSASNDASSAAQPQSRNGARTIPKPGRVALNGTATAARIDRMLREIRPKHTQREVEAERVLHALRKIIDTIPALGPFSLNDAKRALREQNVSIPFPHPPPLADSHLKFAYEPPSSMNVVGSYPAKTATRSRKFLYIDMVVQIPDGIFQEKDYTNHRYFYKRAFYLACLASAIKAGHATSLDIRFQHHHDDSLRPVITIRSSAEHSGSVDAKALHNWQINILPAVSPTLFPSAKLMPDKVSIRRTDSSDAGSSRAQNARYNSSLRADMLIAEYLKLLHKASTSCEAYRDACALGSTWLRQRGFRATHRKGGIASFEWAALVALLLHPSGPGTKAQVGGHFSSLQIFKTVLHLLATRNLIKQPLFLGSDVPPATLATETGPVIWDAVRSHNLLFKMPVWSFRRLQVEAKATLAALGDPDFDGFHASFATKKDGTLLGYDFVVSIQDFRSEDSLAGDDADAYLRLYRILKQGLGNRANQIDLKVDRDKAWDVKSARASRHSANEVCVRILVNPKTVHRAVDHGPPAEDKAAATEFRAFWGDKAELRRFKDGSILEALVWESGTGQASVIEQIIQHLLRHHYDSSVIERTTFTSDAYSRMLGHHEMVFRPLSSQPFQKLESDIRALQDIPIPIRQIVLAQCPGTQSSSLKGKTSDVNDVVLQFESSGRWPDDLAAIQRTKLAFLVNIGELLQDAVDNVHAMIGLENEEHEILNQGFLDVVYPGSAAFRIRIFHDREQTLLERILKNKSSDIKSVDLAAQALATYKREYLRRPAHAQALLQLCSHYPALRGTIVLLKDWFAGHLLSNHVSDELIELLAANTFTRPWPWQAPTSIQTGFLRTLVWLSHFDWRTHPLVADLSTEHKLTSDERKAITSRYDAWRKLDPAMNKVAIFAASSVDPDGTTYSIDQPSKVIAGRITALARAAATEIETQDLQLSPQSLFSSSLADFDFVLHLAPQYATGAGKRGKKGGSFKNLELGAAADAKELGAQPARDFLHELETLYGSAILFLSGLPERAIIAGLWTPQTKERAWKVNLAYSTVPISNVTQPEVNARINDTAILAEISRLGGELIERIELKQDRST